MLSALRLLIPFLITGPDVLFRVANPIPQSTFIGNPFQNTPLFFSLTPLSFPFYILFAKKGIGKGSSA
jgi:hypothetical protein